MLPCHCATVLANSTGNSDAQLLLWSPVFQIWLKEMGGEVSPLISMASLRFDPDYEVRRLASNDDQIV